MGVIANGLQDLTNGLSDALLLNNFIPFLVMAWRSARRLPAPREWQNGSRNHRAVLATLLVVMLWEYAPRPLTTTKLEVPGYVRELARLPGSEAVVDLVSAPTAALYYQTHHQRPMALGYVSRLPESTSRRDDRLGRDLRTGDVPALCARGFRYLVVGPGATRSVPRTREVFAGRRARILEANCDE